LIDTLVQSASAQYGLMLMSKLNLATDHSGQGRAGE
jgi:hypothetical protein